MEKIVEKFWEFAIFVDEKFLNEFEKIKCQTKAIQGCKSVFYADTSHGDYLFAVEQSQQNFLQQKIKQAVINYILNYEKHLFFKKHIKNLSTLNDLQDIFIKVLCLFDTESDTLEIQKNLRLDKQIYLKEFFLFKLKTLQKRWQTICDMTNDNDFFFSSQELVFQLIRFLLKDVKRKNSVISIVNKNNCVKAFQDENILLNLCYQQWTSEVEVQIVLTILDNLPQKIVVQDKSSFDKNFIGLLDLIFKNSLKC